MAERSQWESMKVEGGQLLDRIKELVHEGNVRRVVIKQGDRTVAEFPLTFGVVGAVLAPMLAAVGAIAALITDCSIDIERVETAPRQPADEYNPVASGDAPTQRIAPTSSAEEVADSMR